MVSLIGIAVLFILAILLSAHRKSINWRTVGGAFAIQAIIGALANGLTMPSIPHRLEGLLSHAGLSSKDVKNLRDIWLFLNRLRWRHQIQNKVTDNYVSISDLSSIEKYQLKEAMRVIRRTQQAAVFKFAGGLG